MHLWLIMERLPIVDLNINTSLLEFKDKKIISYVKLFMYMLLNIGIADNYRANNSKIFKS